MARTDIKSVAFSEKVFARLLAAYPKAHREEYGVAMAQLFRDQCRDAWNESRGWGLTKLWLRVFPDMVATSFLAHFEALKERKFMRNRIAMLFRSPGFYRIPPMFTAVFLLVVIPTLIAALVHHESYGCFAMLQIRSGNVQAECEFIQSDAVLKEVISSLDLNAEWGKKLPSGEKLQIPETVVLLRKMLVVETQPPGNRPVITLGVVTDQPDEAVRITDAVVKAYFSERQKQISIRPEQPSNAEIRILNLQTSPIPQFNKPRTIANAVLYGAILGWIASAGASGLSFLIRRFFTPIIAT